jgi:hypothetical protein
MITFTTWGLLEVPLLELFVLLLEELDFPLVELVPLLEVLALLPVEPFVPVLVPPPQALNASIEQARSRVQTRTGNRFINISLF